MRAKILCLSNLVNCLQMYTYISIGRFTVRIVVKASLCTWHAKQAKQGHC